jgi:hypothetical protein
MGHAQGDDIGWERRDGDVTVRQASWRLMRGAVPGEAVFDAWSAIWEGALAVHNRRLELVVASRALGETPAVEWRVRPRRRG